MSGLRGFGMSMQVGGPVRHWYAGSDGVRRWADNDKPVDEFQAAMSAGIPPLTQPDPIAADEAAEGVCALPAWETEAELKGAHDDDRR